MNIPTIRPPATNTIPREPAPKKTPYWNYLPGEEIPSQITSALKQLREKDLTQKNSYQSIQRLTAFAGTCSDPIYYSQAKDQIQTILSDLPICQLQKTIGKLELESKKNTSSIEKTAKKTDKVVSKPNCEEKESAKKHTLVVLTNKLAGFIKELKAPKKIDSLPGDTSNKCTKDLVEWSFYLIKAFVEKTYEPTNNRKEQLSTLLPDILSSWSYTLQKSFFHSHGQAFSKQFFGDLQKEFIKQLRIYTVANIRNSEYLKKIDSWSRKLLENPESLEKNEESNEIFLEFYLNGMLRQFGVSYSDEMPTKKLLERIEKNTSLKPKDKKALFENCYKSLFENAHKSFGHSTIQNMEIAQLPAFFTWDYLATLSEKIPCGDYPNWTKRLQGKISKEFLAPALLKIHQIPLDFESLALKKVEHKIAEAKTEEDLKEARDLLRKEKIAVDLLEGFSKDYPDLSLSIHKTKKAVEAFFHTSILDLINVLKNMYMPLDFLYLSYRLIKSPLTEHLQKIAKLDKAKTYNKYIDTYKKLVGPIDFLKKVHNLGAIIFNDLDPNVLTKTEPNAPRREALLDCTYLVKSWENLDKALSQKPDEKKA